MINIKKTKCHENLIENVCETITNFTENKFTSYNGFIVGRINNELIAYDDICDHNGGTLTLDPAGKSATCQRHKWTLNLEKSIYENGCRKDRLRVEDCKGSIKIYKKKFQFPEIDKSLLTEAPINFYFNAHASVSINVANINLITDPWFIGSCFATGWWHTNPPDEGAVQRLRNSQLIYISHNHPDHLHLPTLRAYVPKDKIFLIPNFGSKSVEKILREEGYTNLIIANFLEEIEIISESGIVKTMIVKSGDDRDDSSLIIFTKDHSVFFGVDTNMPNHWILPRVDLVFTPFAGGASGFPSRIDNFTDKRKSEISNSNRNDLLVNHVRKLMSVTKAKYAVPYAGFFTEAGRDFDLKTINHKNSVNDVIAYLKSEMPNISCIDPTKNHSFSLVNKQIIINANDEKEPLYFIDEEYIQEDINNFSKDTPNFGFKELSNLGEEFIKSNFFDNLTVLILPTDNEFNIISKFFLNINFSYSNRTYDVVEYKKNIIEKLTEECINLGNNVEVLKVREDSLRGVIFKGLPLEYLSIGFQAKMFRNPNVYNFKFWDYFTNHHILKID